MKKKITVILVILLLSLLVTGSVLARAAPHDYHIWLMNHETAWVLCSGEIQVEQLGAQSAKVWCEP